MKSIKLFLPLLLFCSACSNKNDTSKPDIKFERTKWDTKDNVGYPYRKQMANDLLNNYKWAGIKKDSVIKLLGEPDEIEDNTFMIYDYHQNSLGLFEFSGKSLVFELTADSTVKLARKN
jgi:hypothetical protein